MSAPAPTAYLDHASGTPLHPEVRAAMLAAAGIWASPDALHADGEAAAEVLEDARAAVADLLGAAPEEVILTSGPTEARNLAVKGLLSANRDLGRRVVATDLEHPAVRSALLGLAREGVATVTVGVDAEGRVDPAALAAAVDGGTALVCLHHGQEEIGTVQDVPALVAAARGARPEARVHVDAAGTAGLLPVDVRAWGADAVTVGGPAVGAPAWSGVLWLRPGARLHPLIEGGSQEWGKRAGAPDLPAAAALGAAARVAARDMASRAAHRRALAGRLAAGLLAIPGVLRTGPADDASRIPGHVQIALGDVDGETLALALAARGVAVAPGSACTADAGKASPALEAVGLRAPWTRGAILLTLGDASTADEVDAAVAAVAAAVAAMRRMSPPGT